MNGWYDNTLDDFVAANDLAGAKKHIDWLEKNKIPDPDGKNYNSLYMSGSLIKKPMIPELFKYAYDKGIRFGTAFDDMDKINTIIKYNAAQKSNASRIRFVTTEIEPYNATMTYAEMEQLYKDATAALTGTGVRIHTYMGWPMTSFWRTIVKWSNEILLHCYKKSTSMTGDKMWDYIDDRLSHIADAAALENKQIRVSTIFSNEPVFAYDYFKNNPWGKPMPELKAKFDSKATTRMKERILFGDEFMFVTKYGRQIKP